MNEWAFDWHLRVLPWPVRTCVSMLLPVCGSASDTHSSHRGGPCSSRKLCRTRRRKEPLCAFVFAQKHTGTGRSTRRLQQVEEGTGMRGPGEHGPFWWQRSYTKEASSVSDLHTFSLSASPSTFRTAADAGWYVYARACVLCNAFLADRWLGLVPAGLMPVGLCHFWKMTSAPLFSHTLLDLATAVS